MRVEDACQPVFARHETFHPRYGWFKKAVDRATEDPAVFHSDDATIRLGVGKNMVRAIRFWATAARLLTEAPNPDRPRRSLSVPTALGERLLGTGGWDPYLEDPATLWLLHWLLLAPGSRLPAWWIAFGEGTAVEFTERQLLDRVAGGLDTVGGWVGPHPSSVAKDVSCLLRTYAPRSGGSRDRLEDLLDCPFRELGLIHVSDADRTRFRFTIGSKRSLPGEVVAYAALDYVARTDPAARTVTVARLAGETGAPGPVFKLPERALAEALESVARKGQFDVSTVAGAPQLVFGCDPAVVATAVVGCYYGSPSSELAAGTWAARPSPLVIAQLPGFQKPPAGLDLLLEQLAKLNNCWAKAVAV